MKRLILLAAFLPLLLSSCIHWGKKVRGSGNVITDTRSFSNFSSIEAGGAVNVYLSQDSAYSVKVEVDDNLQEYVITRESNGVLQVYQQRNTRLQTTGKIKIYISMPVVRDIDVSGASRVIGENTFTSSEEVDIDLSGASHAELSLNCPKVSAELSGASIATIKGETKDLSISGSGASRARCFDLMSETAEVKVSGATNAEVFASVKLDANASGASHVTYKGNAAMTKDESGAGSVKKVD